MTGALSGSNTTFSGTLGVTGASTLTGAVGVTGALSANGGIINATTANVTPLDVTTTNDQALANNRAVQFVSNGAALAITNTMANPAVKGDLIEVWNVSATNVIIPDAANIEGPGDITLGEFDGVVFRALSTSVWLARPVANN